MNTKIYSPVAAKRLTRIDLADSLALRQRGLHPRLEANVARFANLMPDLTHNLRVQAVSPFSGKFIPPAGHFGIDSDPWMHAIRYEDNGKNFIILCRGLTEASVLGAIFLPVERLMIELRDSWYFQEVYQDRIGRNKRRIERFFAKRPRTLLGEGAGKLSIVAAIGNKRVGDFLMQMGWLSDLLDREGREIAIERVIVNRSSEFLDVGELFPELADRIERQNSGAHIEHRAPYFASPLISDVRPLSDKRAANGLRRRFERLIEMKSGDAGVHALLAPLTSCCLTIWISVEFEKRFWAEQVSGLPALLTEVARTYLRPGELLGLVLNGLTGVEDRSSSELDTLLAQEAELFSAVLVGIQWPVRAVSTAGRTLSVKAVLAQRCDLVLAPVGSASLLPSMLLEKPGVVYGTRSNSRPSFVGRHTRIVPESFALYLPDLKGAIPWRFSGSESYSLDWHCVFQTLRSELTSSRTPDGNCAFTPFNAGSERE